MKTYADRLKKLREVLGKLHGGECSQADLARMLGVSLSALCKWEQGGRVPRGLYREKVERMFKKHKIG